MIFASLSLGHHWVLHPATFPNSALFEELLKRLNITDAAPANLHTGNTSFLRRMWPIDANVRIEMKTISPCFCVERTIHVHIQVYSN